MPGNKAPSRKRRARKRRAGGAKSRRVLLQSMAGVDAHGRSIPGAAVPSSHRLRWSGCEINPQPIVRLTSDGIDWGTWPDDDDEVGYGMHPYRGDDCLSAAVATCTQVPIEQVPDFALDQRVKAGEDPDEISHSTWERLDGWADKRGLALMFSEDVPLAVDRWIGVVEFMEGIRDRARRDGKTRIGTWVDRAGERVWVDLDPDNLDPEAWGEACDQLGMHHFSDHCVVMRRAELWFDPSCSVRLPRGATRSYCFDPSDVSYGIAFIRKET